MTMELVPAMMITLDLPVLIAQVKGYLLYPQALRMVPRVWNHFYKVGPIVIGVWPLRLQHQDLARRLRAGAPRAGVGNPLQCGAPVR